MRILGHNLLPFAGGQLSSSAATAGNPVVAQCFFFSSDMPKTLGMLAIDYRQLLRQADTVSHLSLKASANGLAPIIASCIGYKAISGSLYNSSLDVTVHYPRDIQPVSTSGSGTDIVDSYGTGVTAGNKKLFGNMSRHPYTYPGFPRSDALNTLPAYGVCDVQFDASIAVNCMVSLGSNTAAAISGTTVAVKTQDGYGMTATLGNSVTWSIAANANIGNSSPDQSSRYRITQNSGLTRRSALGTKGNTSPATKSVTPKWAILLVPDSNFGALADGSNDLRVCVCDVGAIGSGAFIELNSTTLGVGDFASIAQIRTALETVK